MTRARPLGKMSGVGLVCLVIWAIMQDAGTAGGGTATWVWFIVGMAAVLGVGGVALFLSRRSAKPQ